MLAGKPWVSLILFGLPIMLGNLFQQFYNLIDSAVVGRFVGEDALAAVGASYSVTNVFIAVAIGGGMGCGVIISQYLGAGRINAMKTAARTAMLTFLAVSLTLGILGFFLSRRILVWMDTPANVLSAASVYLQIYFCGLPFLFMYNIQSAIFNALGDSRTPLLLLIFSSVLNVILDVWFVISLYLGVAGVAIATLIAQGISAVISLILLTRKIRFLRIPEEDTGPSSVFSGKILASMGRVALPSILQQSIVSIGMLLVQAVINGFGSSVLAGYTAAMRIQSVCIVPLLALGNAVSTFTAQNMGAGRPDRIRRGYRSCYLILLALCLAIFILLRLNAGGLISLFLDSSHDRTALDTGVSCTLFLSWFYLFMGLKAITDGVLRGAGDAAAFTLANLANLAIRTAAAWLFAPVLGAAAVWYSIPMGWAVNYLISGLRYLTGKWSRRDLI